MSTHSSYVGVSGFMSSAEVCAALEVFPACGRQLMVGVLASSKTLCGLPNKYPRRYPLAADIAGIFVDDARALNLVHVATDGDKSTVDGKLIPIEIDLWRGFLAGGPLCHGVQLNGATQRLRPEALHAFKAMCPTAKHIVLQVGPRWLDARSAADSFMKSLARYAGTATDILLDVSGGNGRLINPETARELVVDARRSLAHWGIAADRMGIGIAGGLCAETLPGIRGLLEEQGPLSIDMEGRIRDDADGGGNMDLDKMRAALAVAGRVVTR